MMNNWIFLLIPLAGLLVGIWLAFAVNFPITEETATFVAMALIISLELLIEGTAQFLNSRFRLGTMLMNYILNLSVAFFLLVLGNLMRVDLYMALFIVFGFKMFNNLSYISQKFFSKLRF